MGPPLPQKLTATTTTLGALSCLTIALRCYVRLRIVKSWGLDDTFIFMAFIAHMWYTGTLLTGIHYGTGRRTADISASDSVHAMRCWWICFLAYASTITLAKISAGFFFLRISGVKKIHRVATYFVTILAAIVGFVYFFVSLFQCNPVDFFWTRLEGKSGTCMSIDVIILLTYIYGTVSALTDVSLGLLVFALVWNLKVDRKTKMLISPFLAMACIASYAAMVRMPYIENFRSNDFLYSTVDISLWSTVEVGVSVFAANLATLRPLFRHVTDRSLSSRSRSGAGQAPPMVAFSVQNLEIVQVQASDKDASDKNRVPADEDDLEAGSTISLTKSSQEKH